jgi:hypothetical protein
MEQGTNSADDRKAPGKASGFAAFLLRRRAGRALLAVTLLGLFFGGYAAMAPRSHPVVSHCLAGSGDPILPDFDTDAADLVPPFIFGTAVIDTAKDFAKELVQESPVGCPCYTTPVGFVPWPSPCDFVTESKLMVEWLEDELKSKLASTAYALEIYIGDWLVSGMVATMLNVINQTELNLIDWWDTMWYYNMLPAMQDMVKQIGVSMADQVRAVSSGLDASQGGGPMDARHKEDDKAIKDFKPSENAAVLATLTGGQQRAAAIGIAMQSALQNEAHAFGMNRRTLLDGTPNPGSKGYNAALAAKRKQYETMFCNPNGNNGHNNCQCDADPAGPGPHTLPVCFIDVDTQFTKQVYARLTIDLLGSSGAPPVSAKADPGFKFKSPMFIKAAEAAGPGSQTIQTSATPTGNEIPEAALSALIDNMIGDPVADPVPPAGLGSAEGRERYLNRRRDLARYAVARSIPDFIVGRRMPGSQLNKWVKELRDASGAEDDDISANPSYREVLHSMVVDRFNSGQYAVGMNDEESVVEREKLMMNVIYLMQLRDYYELLEREAAVLAVQVSLMADQVPLPETRGNQRM